MIRKGDKAECVLCSGTVSLVYADPPHTLDHLEDNIRRVIADIRPQMLEKVIENWTSRLDYIRASRGSPMPEIIFKMPVDNLPLDRQEDLLWSYIPAESQPPTLIPEFSAGSIPM
ncbi:hypothetical protein TNCV_4073201 [Trichonephila clavipes]|uniref:Uncharacterized protein n=1 Tax=Trichonephila clavipes TaxID=2585209 RepID=A0A8X6W7Z0_TRICX|nr:hypothetical protein TNCV_4073201 [Trichonephila clavipes]